MNFEDYTKGGEEIFEVADVDGAADASYLEYDTTDPITADYDDSPDIDDNLGEAGTEQGRFLPFRQEFDGTQSPSPLSELKAAASNLAEFADDAAGMSIWPRDGQVVEDGYCVGVRVSSESSPLPGSDLIPRASITFTQQDADGQRTGDCVRYELENDGVVYRRDETLEQYEKNRAEMADLPPLPKPGENIPPERRTEITNAHLNWVQGRIRDLTMETNFGFFRQPVGVEEINNAISLARRALANNPDAWERGY
ncbi:MAG TPA: hypothetical protein VFM05_12095 [Candidatus Saccharimonadales bacterium]|nr:hypothetical protein [Candidatus Saccharimonadales bacterium]